MATVVTYNGVELHNVTTREWNEEVVYDASGTDLLYRRVHMRFQGIMHRAATGISGSDPWGPAFIKGPGTNANQSTPEIFNELRPRLLMPRAELKVEMNSQVVLFAKASAGYNLVDSDLDGGPKPRVATLSHVAGDRVFRLDFSIECTIDAAKSPLDSSPLGGSGQSVVINNRWAIAESLSDTFAVTRTIRGRLRLSRWITNAHDFRKVVVPPLEATFKRESMAFQVSESGLDCEYTIVDRQIHIAAPWPAVKVEATYTESTNDGIDFWADMNVTLEGPISAGVQLMMIQAMRIIDTRLKIIESQQSQEWKKYQFIAGSLTEHIGERNVVEAHVRIKHIRAPSEAGGVAKIWAESFGQNVGGTERLLDLSAYAQIGPKAYSVWHSREPELFGYLSGANDPRQAAFLFALGCYYQDPWHPQVMQGNLVSNGIGAYPNPAPLATITFSSGSSLTPADTNISPETKEAIYSFTRMSTRYVRENCNVILPVALDPSTAKDTDDTCAVVSIGPQQFRREIHYDMERIGDYPELIGYADEYSDGGGNLTGTLIRSWDRILPPGLTADKTQTIHRSEGYRLYAISRPPLSTESVRVGILPHTKFTQADNAVVLDKLVTTRMEA